MFLYTKLRTSLDFFQHENYNPFMFTETAVSVNDQPRDDSHDNITLCSTIH